MRFDEVLTQARTNSSCGDDTPWVRVSGRGGAAMEVREALAKGLRESGVKARLFGAGSFGYGDLEPVVTVCLPCGPTVLYDSVDAANACNLVIDYLKNGRTRPEAALCTLGKVGLEGVPRAEDLPLFGLQNRLALRNCGVVDPDDVDGYLTCAQGYSGLSKALQEGRDAVMEALRGAGPEGSAGCGIADALEALSAVEGGEKYVVCNGVDGDRGLSVSTLLLEGDPHAVLEGMLIAAYTAGAGRLFLCVSDVAADTTGRLHEALEEMARRGLVGDHILDSSFSCPIEVRQVPPSLVAKDETALVRFLEGKQAMPAVRPEGGSLTLFGRPALVLFPEALSRAAAALRPLPQDGHEKGAGTGTRVVVLSGDVVHPRVVEVPKGTLIRTLVEEIGGGVAPGRAIKAVGVGCPIGELLGPEGLDIPIDSEPVARASIDGPATVEVFDTERCAVELACERMAFFRTQTCGKCVFCREGILQMCDILDSIATGEGTKEDLELLGTLGRAMETGSICLVGKNAAAPVLGGLDLFRHEYDAHVKNKGCPVNRKE